jgi:chromosome partitioning protein
MKGGVAKTTLAVNIADCLVRRHNKQVLIIDIDPQFNATQCLISGHKYVKGIKDGRDTILKIFDDSPRPIVGSVEGSTVSKPKDLTEVNPWEIKNGLYLLPGDLEIYRLEMPSGQGRENRLKRYINHIRETSEFDFVIIDTPPTPSVWMASALIASDWYLVPVKPEPLSATGIDLLRVIVNNISENHALKIQCAGVVLTIAEETTRVFRQTVKFIDKNKFWSGKRFTYSLPKRTRVASMQGIQKMILDINDPILLRSITAITQEFLQRIGA